MLSRQSPHSYLNRAQQQPKLQSQGNGFDLHSLLLQTHTHTIPLRLKQENKYLGVFLLPGLSQRRMEPQRCQTSSHPRVFPSLDTRAASPYPKRLLVSSAPPSFPWLQICSPVISLIHVLPHREKTETLSVKHNSGVRPPDPCPHDLDGCAS